MDEILSTVKTINCACKTVHMLDFFKKAVVAGAVIATALGVFKAAKSFKLIK